MLEIVSSAHRVPRAEGARRREEGTVQRTVPCVAYRSATLSLVGRWTVERGQIRNDSIIQDLFVNCTHGAPIWAPADPLGRRLAATAAGQQGLGA